MCKGLVGIFFLFSLGLSAAPQIFVDAKVKLNEQGVLNIQSQSLDGSDAKVEANPVFPSPKNPTATYTDYRNLLVNALNEAERLGQNEQVDLSIDLVLLGIFVSSSSMEEFYRQASKYFSKQQDQESKLKAIFYASSADLMKEMEDQEPHSFDMNEIIRFAYDNEVSQALAAQSGEGIEQRSKGETFVDSKPTDTIRDVSSIR